MKNKAELTNNVTLIDANDDFFGLKEKWNEINDNSLKGNVFNSWEWLYTWWEIYQNEGQRNLYILCCNDNDNNLLGIAPFQIVNNPKKYFPCNHQLLLLGTGETDGSLVFGEYMDLLIKPGHETNVLNAFSSYLVLHNNLWDGLKFQQQLAGSHLSHLFEEKFQNTPLSTSIKFEKIIVENGFRTIVELPETYKDYLMSLRKKTRNNVTRTFSRLESEQNFTIESTSSESELEAEASNQSNAMDILSGLNKVRRGNIEKNSVFDRPNFTLFHRSLLKRLLPLDKVSLRVLLFCDEPVAALYCFVDGDTVHAYQSGFETENGHRYSLLTTMLTQEISYSIENIDINRFNFMYSDNPDTYKKRYAAKTEKMYDITYDKKNVKYSVYRIIHGPLKSLVKKCLRIN